MQLKIFCSWWGLDHLGLKKMIEKIHNAGFDGVECYVPHKAEDRKTLRQLLEKYQLDIIAHQFQATGTTFEEFANSYKMYLMKSAEFQPLLINSHTGKDYWTMEKNGLLIQIAEEIEKKFNVKIVHETHRGRFPYAAVVANEYLKKYPYLKLNADFSHWTCVSESLLEDQSDFMENAIKHSYHIHARVGYEEGPQIPDPNAAEWEKYLQVFMNWWRRILKIRKKSGDTVMTITPEFGPIPYTWALPFSKEPVSDFFEINCWMKDYLKENL